MTPRVPTGLVLRRGLRRRCPRCGVGPLFKRWIEAHERCSACGVLLQRDYGDVWLFLLLVDRIPIFLAIVILYFGFRSTHWFGGTTFFVILFIPIVATMRERQGLAFALDYLSRIWFPDAADEIHDGREIVLNAEGRVPDL
jgi:uncharacterized protein (DUF983 family)